MNDDDAYQLHERLKGFFNRLLEKEKSAPAAEAKKDTSDLYEVEREESTKKLTRTEIVDQIKHFLQEKY